jgi:hypothetical protein
MKPVEKLFLVTILLLGIPLGIYYLIIYDIKNGYRRAAAEGFYNGEFRKICKSLECKDDRAKLRFIVLDDFGEKSYIIQTSINEAKSFCSTVGIGDTLIKKAKTNKTMVLKLGGDTTYLKEKF